MWEEEAALFSRRKANLGSGLLSMAAGDGARTRQMAL